MKIAVRAAHPGQAEDLVHRVRAAVALVDLGLADPGTGYGGPRPSGPGGPSRPGGFGGPRTGGFGAPRSGGPGEGTGRERNFGPPAPPKGKKGKGNFQQKERGPKGPIPTKFTGRMYDLDEVDASEDAVDEVPEFMKPDADDVDEVDTATGEVEGGTLDEAESDVDPHDRKEE